MVNVTLGSRPPAQGARARARPRGRRHGPVDDGGAPLRRHPVRRPGARGARAVPARPPGAGRRGHRRAGSARGRPARPGRAPVHAGRDAPAGTGDACARDSSTLRPEDLAAGARRRAAAPAGAAQVLDITDLFEVPPLPNWCFQRDPQIVIGSGVVFASMASAAREREARLARVLFRFHPDLAATPRLHEPLEPPTSSGRTSRAPGAPASKAAT